MYDCQVDIVKAGEATEFKPDQEAIELAYIAARNVTTEELARPLGLKLGSEDCTIMLRRSSSTAVRVPSLCSAAVHLPVTIRDSSTLTKM